MKKNNVTPIGARKRPVGTAQPITPMIVVDDGGQGWVIALAFVGPDMRDLIALAIENYRHVEAIIGARTEAAGISSGHPFVKLEARPLTEEQYEGLKGTVEIW